MSSKLRLRIALEGEDPVSNSRRRARLKSEWPDLYNAIEDAAYDDDPVDLYAIAESISPKKEIVLNVDEVQDYLDLAIRGWRNVSNNSDHPSFELAPYYIDAFQSVRLSLLGDLLPLDGKDDTE